MTTILAILTAVVNSLWQAIAVAALVWLALRFAQRTNAATRYAIWWAALAVVLVLPVAPRLILMLRPHREPVALEASKAPAAAAPAVIAEPVIVTVAPGRTAIWPIAVLIVWASILLWRLYQIARSYFYLRSVKRRATVSPIPLPEIPRRADLLISSSIVSPMAVGFVRPAIVLPESLLEELSEPEREHVLLHEAAHLAKYDDWSNLAMRILAGALALHPVAIWILWQIEREREMACDDWVVARTGAARPYAASLAHLFELRRARRDEILASGIFGGSSQLGARIEMLLRRGRTFSPRASVAGIVASTLVLGGLMLAGSFVPRWIAFAQRRAPLSFEVASVKPNDSGGLNFSIRILPGGRLRGFNAPLRSLITAAYQIPDSKLSGGPGWVDSARFDIEAKGQLDPAKSTEDQISQMLQKLLADRFQLKLHKETKELPVYVLLIAQNGLKLESPRGIGCFDPYAGVPPPTPRPGEPPARPCGGFNILPGQFLGAKVPMWRLAMNLSRILGRNVVNQTGLEGPYDITLRWSPNETQETEPPSADNAGPSIFTAIQEQLGLQLKSTKGPVEYFVIDHAEKPDAN